MHLFMDEKKTTATWAFVHGSNFEDEEEQEDVSCDEEEDEEDEEEEEEEAGRCLPVC